MHGIAQPLRVAEVADRLGVSTRRVQQMLGDGRIPGEKFGSQWVVDGRLLDDLMRRGRVAGRPLHPRNVWLLLLQASGVTIPRSGDRNSARMRALLRSRSLESLRPALGNRGRSVVLNAHPGVLAVLGTAPEIVLSGVSAANHHRLGIASSGEIEGYVRAQELAQLVGKFALTEHPDGNVFLRIVDDGAWMLEDRFAPVAAVALDLADARDPRSQRVGLRALREIDRERPADDRRPS